MQKKIYDPVSRVAYIIYNITKKGKKSLYSACGNIDDIKEYCNRNGIDYSKCNINPIAGIHYLEENKIYDGRDFKM